MDNDENVRMREASGEFKSKDPMVSFVYVVLRDGCPPEVMESALIQMHSEECLYTNGWLARYAEDIAGRLRIAELEDSDPLSD